MTAASSPGTAVHRSVRGHGAERVSPDGCPRHPPDSRHAEARQHGLRCVRIVHGKGLRSKAHGPVLKQLTDTLLRRRADVLAFTSARPTQGGTGAVIVLLQPA